MAGRIADPLASRRPDPRSGHVPWPRRSATLVRDLAAAVRHGRVDTAVDVIDDAVAEGVPAVQLYVDVLPAVLVEIDAAAAGGAGVSDPGTLTWSRTAIHHAERVLGAVAGLQEVGDAAPASKGAVVLGAPEGEWHDIPMRIVAEVLTLDGYDVVALGASVPPAAFRAAVERHAADLVAVGISVATQAGLDAAAPLVRLIRSDLEAFDRPVTVAVGGPAVLSLQESRHLGADTWAPDARGLALVLDARLRRRPRPALLR